MTTLIYPTPKRIVSNLLFITAMILGIIYPSFAQDCNNPLSGKDAVVDEINSGLACLLCGNPATQNVIDGDLSNFLEVNNLASLPGAASLISVKDIRQDYPAGRRTGFVIEPISGLLSAGLLANFQIRTYLNNVPQETATFGGGGLLNVNILGGAGSKQRLDFVTTEPFDEVELVVTSALTGLNMVRIYYAYEEAATGCDYNCITEIVPNEGYTPTIVGSRTGITGTCVLCSIDNANRSIDNNLNNAATINFGLLSVGATGSLSVNAGTTIAGGNDVGFAIEQDGLLGLLSLNVLGNIRLTTYLSGTQRETILANAALANVGVLNASNLTLVSFKTSLSFDEVRISITNISLGLDYNVYYAFIRPDADNDGFPDCVDKCVGNDNLDADGDGTPDACDLVCTVNAGLDVSICPPANTAQLVAAGSGQTWSAALGNPSPATISNAGTVSGLSSEGTYLFVLTEGTCRDTVALNYVESAIDYTCNDPIAGYGTVISDGGLVGGICLLCNSPQATNVIDGDLSNFIEYNALLSLLSNTSLISVEDTIQTYPAGTRTGFVVSGGGGLLDASVLGAFQIRTYLNGVLQETATTAGNVLGATAVGGAGNKQRISFVTTQPFDEVELVIGNVLGLLSSIRVYYAFEENAASCPNSGGELSCVEVLTASSTYCAMIEYERTDFTGVACVLCEFDSLAHLIDDNTTNASSLTLTVGALTNASVAVSTRQTIPAGYEAGFAIAGGAQLLNANVLGGLRMTTYLNGIQQESILASNPLLNATLLDNGSSLGLLSFRTTLPFNEVQLTVQAPIAANVLSSLNIYYAFVRRDTDGDGTPDCYDKCCSGNDNLDLDGNVVPDACDAYADAVDDVANATTFTATNIDVLANDDFGADGPGSLAIAFPPTNGTAVVNNNGTPADPSDDYIIYTSTNGFTGNDTFKYRICDSNGSCDEATVTVTVSPAFVRLQAKMLLQGALLGALDTLMRDTLRRADLLPATEPYTGLNGFIHINGGGGESIATANVFNDFGANSIVDWVFIELRDPNNPATVVATRAALLQRDGDIVDVDGTSALTFSQSSPGSYYVAVRHRNHLGTMTAATVALSMAGTVIDFTNTNLDLRNNTPAFNGREQVTMSGKYALWAGNSNVNTSVIFAGQNNDKETIFNAVDQVSANLLKLQTYLLFGYRAEDVNLSTRTIFAGQGNDVDVIFNDVDSHPVNLLKLQTFIIPQQLANQ